MIKILINIVKFIMRTNFFFERARSFPARSISVQVLPEALQFLKRIGEGVRAVISVVCSLIRVASVAVKVATCIWSHRFCCCEDSDEFGQKQKLVE